MTPHQAEIVARNCVRDHVRAMREVDKHGWKRENHVVASFAAGSLRERFGVSLMRCGAWIAGYRPTDITWRVTRHERVARCRV